MTTLELADNIIQLLALLLVLVAACLHALRTKTAALQYFICAIACAFVGNLFWSAYFLVYGDFPYYFSAAELCYLAFFLSLAGACIALVQQHRLALGIHHLGVRVWVLPVLVFGANMLCYALVGGLLWNLYYAIPLAWLAYQAVRGLLLLQNQNGAAYGAVRGFYVAVVGYLIATNVMFVLSCVGYNGLYLCCDFCVTLSFLCMFFYLRKAVAA